VHYSARGRNNQEAMLPTVEPTVNRICPYQTDWIQIVSGACTLSHRRL